MDTFNDYELWLVFVLIGYRETAYSKVKTRNNIHRLSTNGDMTHKQFVRQGQELGNQQEYS